jgi:hypothetical protein
MDLDTGHLHLQANHDGWELQTRRRRAPFVFVMGFGVRGARQASGELLSEERGAAGFWWTAVGGRG